MPVKGAKLSEQSKILTNDEIVRLVSLFAGQGVDKIRITGGEPTVNKNIVQIVGEFNTFVPRYIIISYYIIVYFVSVIMLYIYYWTKML